MSIEFNCAHCGKLLRVPDEFAGRAARCPHCGSVSQASSGTPTPASSETAAWAPPMEKGAEQGAENADDASPYQSPATEVIEVVSSQAASAKVQGPAIALIVVGALDIILSIMAIGLQVFQFAFFDDIFNEGPNPFPIGAQLGVGFNIISAFVGLVISGLMVYGGMEMRKLRNYGLAMTAGILAIVPCFGACCLWDLPIGIWAVVVLSQTDVKAAFLSNNQIPA